MSNMMSSKTRYFTLSTILLVFAYLTIFVLWHELLKLGYVPINLV